MVLSSLKTPADSMQVPPVWIPHTPSLDAYEKVSGLVNVGRSMWNSLVIASIITVGILVTSMMAGYAFAKYHYPARSLLFSVLIATMYLPPIVKLIPLYRLVGSMGLNASLAGIIVPNLANAFDIFLMRQFTSGVPNELIVAARMDGASELLILNKIVAPSLAPAIAALALFAFVYHWNSYLWPLTVLQGSADAYPTVIRLSRLFSYNRGALNTALVMAGATLAVLPPLILFGLLQRFFVDSSSARRSRG